ncbi:MAG TPA: hypothetical protein VJN18_25380 [Polyangiaceae bacterium]|nr:hypothetical protein [Polyangiaceae bacterium]
MNRVRGFLLLTAALASTSCGEPTGVTPPGAGATGGSVVGGGGGQVTAGTAGSSGGQGDSGSTTTAGVGGAGGSGGAGSAVGGAGTGGASMGGEGPGGASGGKNIMVLVGDANGTVAKGQGIGDRFIKDRLQNVLGHHVTEVFDTAEAAAMLSAAEAADLVLITESPSSTYVMADLRLVTKPILSYEAFLQDNLGFAVGSPGDPGLPSQFGYGVKMSDDSIDIVNPSHPLAAGLSGNVKVYSALKEITWATVAPTAEVVATLSGDTSGASIYVYHTGVMLFDGTSAAALRVNLFLEDDNMTGTPNLMTTDGLKLFDAAVAYSLTTP